MRFSLNATIVALAVMLISAPMLLASDAVSQCGAVQAKVLGTLYKSLLDEATKACVNGSAGHPQSVDVAKLTDVTNKVNAALQKSIDKFGSGNCYQSVANIDPANLISTAQALAAELCLVPSPTPTP